MNRTGRLISLWVAIALMASACVRSAPGAPAVRPAPKFKIALILPSGKDDMAWSQGMYEGVMAAQKELGEADVQVKVSENLVNLPDASAAIRDYASQKFDVIIAHGSQFQNVVLDVAKEFPDITFAYGTGLRIAPNVYAYDPQAQTGAYVMGMVAANLTKSKIVGIVGPAQAGDAIKYNTGFKAGVASVNPNIKVLESYTGSFGDTLRAKAIAQAHMDRGADLLTGTAQQSVGAIQAAAEKPGVYWLSSDMDQSSLAPNTVLMAQTYLWKDVVRTMVDNRTKNIKGGQVLSLNLANGRIVMVLNPKLADKVPTALKAEIEQTQKDIARGKITVPLPK